MALVVLGAMAGPLLRGEKKISKNELKPGDHIYTYRAAYMYNHHGIYEGNGNVIHFDDTGVSRCTLDHFLSYCTNIYLYEYGKCDPPEDVLSRARFLLCKEKGFGDYHLTLNNCEDFAIFCKTATLVFDKNNKPVRPRSTQATKANIVLLNILAAIGSPLGMIAFHAFLASKKHTEKKISNETFYNEYRYKS